MDSWTLKEADVPGVDSYSGNHSWFIGDPNNGDDLRPGVDNSLYTRQIDLTNARAATLEAMLRFNIDTAPGRPPDGFRVEVSTDNKETWVPLNLGVRAAWGVSGTEPDEDDGIPGDGKSYTGLDLDGNGNNWVPANSLTRLSTNLAAFTGNVINIRFRVVTNTDATHYADAASDMGIYIDDVFIYGSSLVSTRSSGKDIKDDAKEETGMMWPEIDITESILQTNSDPVPDEENIVTTPSMDQNDPVQASIHTGSGNEAIPAGLILMISSMIAALPVVFVLWSRRRREL